jgi:hypothetical protein
MRRDDDVARSKGNAMHLPVWVWVLIVIAVLCALGLMNLSISF